MSTVRKSREAADPAAGGPVASIAVLDGETGTAVSHYRLEPGVRVRIGRELTNQVRVSDGSCSRVHCEVFRSHGVWLLRDNRSRNGTFVDGRRIDRDAELVDGTEFRLGDTHLRFVVTDPTPRKRASAKEFDTRPEMAAVGNGRPGSETVMMSAEETLQDARPIDPAGPVAPRPDLGPRDDGDGPVADVIGTARRSRYSDPEIDAGDPAISQVFGRLYELAAQMADAPTVRDLTDRALKGLLENTRATIGGVLMLPSTKAQDRSLGKLELKAFEGPEDLPYTRVSRRVSDHVFRREEGVHFLGDGEGGVPQSESVEELAVASAACVPVKLFGRMAGLVHLYTQDVGDPVTEDDFHFALAVGERMSDALSRLKGPKSTGLSSRPPSSTEIRETPRGSAAIVGESEAIRRLRSQIERVAPTDATALIRGESGVGKELVAEAMHYSSRRSGGPFVCMNCAALSESLLESELFGHEKGAFTGATGQKMGKFEAADGGTLLLDEVGEMTPAIQSKFLRVLEGHPFERVGGSKPIITDVRVVAATNRDLEEAVREGTFRKDLYFRLQVMQVDIPPLRERLRDVPLLAQHFVERFRVKSGRDVRGLSPAANSKLVSYHWPGNIRELLNTIERAVILAETDLIGPDEIYLSTLEGDAGGYATPPPDDGEFLEQSIEDLERGHILRTLEAMEWNKTRAAQVLGIERSTLDRKLKRYGVSRPD